MTKSEWWRGGVIYQIYPRSFMDSNGDGIGDLPGITSRLEHVASLGVDAIWISPFFKSPMKDFGYDVSDYRDVDPVFGTLDDFKILLDRAHSLGLKVMTDQVWSHTSDQHDWFKESRQSRDNAKADWYIWSDPKPDGTAPNNWLSYFGGPAWTWDARRRQYYLHHFLKEQPSLNYWNPEVKQAIKNTAAFWLDMGVDGFRLDVAHAYVCDRTRRDNPARTDGLFPTDVPASNPMALQSRIYSMNVPENIEWIEELCAYIAQWPDRALLGEAGGDDSEKVAASYTQTGKRFQQAYSFGLVGTAMQKEDILKTISRIEEVVKDGWICLATSNHDFKRVASRLQGEAPLKDKALFATILGLSLRGSYCMYQGEELGLPQADLAYDDLVDPYDKMLYPEHVGRDGCRTPIPWVSNARYAGFSAGNTKPWLPVSPVQVPLAVDVQEQDSDSVLSHVRNFLLWRKGHDALRLGDITILDVPGSLFAFRRSHKSGSILCIFNCSDAEVSINADFAEGLKMLEGYSRNIVEAGGKIHFKPFAFGFFGKP